jgi:hypothetical protein
MSRKPMAPAGVLALGVLALAAAAPTSAEQPVPKAKLSASPHAVDCGTAPVGGSVACPPVTLTNDGSVDTAVVLIGNSSNKEDSFGESGGCGALPVGASCVSVAVFFPQSVGRSTDTMEVLNILGEVIGRYKVTGVGV